MNHLRVIPIKRIFLQSLILSVAISAILGILAILLGDFGEFQIKVLLTTLTISGASLCGLCCGASIELRGKTRLAVSGILFAAVAALFVIGGLWFEPRSHVYWKLTMTVTIFAVTKSHLSLLKLAHMNRTYAWAMPAAFGTAYSVVLLLLGMIWGKWSEEIMFRLLGVAAVLDGAITILIPIFHRLGRGELPTNGHSALADIDREIAQLENRLRELKAQRQAVEEKPFSIANFKN